MQYFKQFKRVPSFAEREELAADYNQHFDTEDGRTAIRFGDESLNEAMKLTKGEEYSKVLYNEATDSFYWKHDNVLDRTIEFDDQGEPIEVEPAAYDAQDAACDRYHHRKEL